MPLVFMDSCAGYAQPDIASGIVGRKWDGATGAFMLESGAGRRGGNALVNSAGTAGVIWKSLGEDHDDVLLSTAVKPGGATTLLQLCNGSTEIARVDSLEDGAFAVYFGGEVWGYTEDTYDLGSWHHLRLMVRYLEIGSYKETNVYASIDGTNFGDYVPSGTGFSVNRICLNALPNKATKFCDTHCAVADTGSPYESFDLAVDAIYPSGDGHYSQFTPSGADYNYECVNKEWPPVSSPTIYNGAHYSSDKIDSFSLGLPDGLSSNSPDDLYRVYGLQIHTWGAIRAAEHFEYEMSNLLRVNGVDHFLPATEVTSSGKYIYSEVFSGYYDEEDEPSPYPGWSDEAIRSLETGYRGHTLAGEGVGAVYQHFVEIVYFPSLDEGIDNFRAEAISSDTIRLSWDLRTDRFYDIYMEEDGHWQRLWDYYVETASPEHMDWE